MRNSFTLYLIVSVFFLSENSFAAWQDTPYNRTFIKNKKEQPSYSKQLQLRNSTAWKQFAQNHADWSVLFDERNAMPHRAYGNGIKITSSGDAAVKAMSFLKTEMSSFNLPVDNLSLRNAHDSKKFQYVDYYQKYLGLEVLNSRVTVRMTLDNRVVLFGADVFNDISLSTNPQLSSEVISSYAVSGIDYEITGLTVDPSLKILPVPADGKYEYHLVYLVTVGAKDIDGFPSRFYTLVDANNGEVLYRHDQIDHLDNLLTVKASVSDPNPWEPTVIQPLPNLRVQISGTDYYTDAGGNLSLTGISLPVNSTIYLQGTWSKVVTGSVSNTVANFTQTLNTGVNTADFTTHAAVQHRSAYYHVNVIHDYMKSYLPSFTEMDEALLTRVDVTGQTCNAFYDGSSINFYAQGAGCFDLATAADVVYHEYSHGTDGRFYSLFSNGLDNGALNEGYSDTWAIAKTGNPVLGIGISDSDPNAYVRRYDINKKIYPQDIQGEEHADGEIICGCWYDTRLNTGDVNTMMNLFVEALNGVADGFDGSEGTVYRDVLLDALSADDDDGNLNNGTPHDMAILSAFALHGITLVGDINLSHTEPTVASAEVPVSIEATITEDWPIYFGSAWVHYKMNTETTYDSAQMSLISGITYSVDLPAQPKGIILDYYFTVKDIYGLTALTKPGRVVDATPNLPYKMLISFNTKLIEDFDVYEGPWVLDDASDNAISGQWVVDSPNPTYITLGVPSSLVQTGTDHTPNSPTNFCAFTGQADTNDPIGAGANDCDEGRNTLYSPKYDLTTYTNPAISYYRWYSNDQGVNPGNDPWRVYITNGDDVWKVVENTYAPDHGWRFMALRVLDYVDVTDKVQLKFVVSDSLMLTVSNQGQSLVEAAVDDLYLWNQEDNVAVNEVTSSNILMISPNPAVNDFTVKLTKQIAKDAILELENSLGKSMFQTSFRKNSDQAVIPVKNLETGIYMLRIVADNEVYSAKVVVQH